MLKGIIMGQCAHSNDNLKTFFSATLVVKSYMDMNSHNPQFSLFPFKFSFLSCLASLVLSMFDSNVIHRVTILSHNTAKFGTSESSKIQVFWDVMLCHWVSNLSCLRDLLAQQYSIKISKAIICSSSAVSLIR